MENQKSRTIEYGSEEYIWDKVRKQHGRNRGNKCFPCGYCYYYNIGIIPNVEHKSNIVIDFKDDIDPDNGNHFKVFCDGDTCIGKDKEGHKIMKNGPTDYGYCKGFAYQETDVRTHCIDEVFGYIEKDYTMFIISKLYEYPDGIRNSKIIDRRTKGYHTREKRIRELIDDGYIDMLDGNIITLTPTGNRLAMAIRDMYDDVMRCINIGDLLLYKDCVEVFVKVRDNPKSSADRLTEGMNADQKEMFGRLLVDLENEGYVSSQYAEDYETIVFSVTDMGMRCYARYVANEERDGNGKD